MTQLEEMIVDSVNRVVSDFKQISNRFLTAKYISAVVGLCTSQHLFKEEFSILNAPLNERARSLIVAGPPGSGKTNFIQTIAKVFYVALLNEKDFNLHYINADSMPQQRLWLSEV